MDEWVVCDKNKREKWRKFSVRCFTGIFYQLLRTANAPSYELIPMLP